MNATGTTVIVGLLAALGAAGQTRPAAPLAFEVASIHVDTSGQGVQGGCHGIDSHYGSKDEKEAPPLGRCVITSARLSHMIGIAFDVTMQNLKTGPDWIQRGALRFVVQAEAEDPAHTTEKQLLTMLQNLLIDRFQLKFHYDTGEDNGFVLTVAKGGPKIKAAGDGDPSISLTGAGGKAILKPGGSTPLTLHAEHFSIGQLTELLSQLGAYGPGVDQTGLTGQYNFELSWDEENGPALPAALNQQLGLRMAQQKVPVKTFVVDSAEKPSAN